MLAFTSVTVIFKLKLCIIVSHSFGSYQIASIHDSYKNIYTTMISFDENTLFDIIRPGADGSDEAKLLDETVVEFDTIKTVNVESVTKIAASKKLKVPIDLNCNTASFENVLVLVKDLAKQASNTTFGAWNWDNFVNELGMQSDSTTINCMKYFIYHCICNQDCTRNIDIRFHAMENQIVQQATQNIINGSNMPILDTRIEVTNISSISDQINILNLPQLSQVDTLGFQQPCQATNNHTQMPALEDKDCKTPNNIPKDHMLYGIVQADFVDNSLKSLNKHICVSTNIAAATANDNGNSKASKTESDTKNSTLLTRKLAIGDEKTIVKGVWFKQKTVSVIGNFSKKMIQGKDTRQRVLNSIEKMEAKPAKRFGKRSVLFVVGCDSKKSQALKDLAKHYKQKPEIYVVKADYIFAQQLCSKKIERNQANQRYFWAVAKIVK